MNIQYYGQACFKITTKPAGRGREEVAIFINLFDKSVGLRSPRGNADLILMSHNHSDNNKINARKSGAYIIDIPGEYSIKGINIIGVSSFYEDKNKPECEPNTFYILESEDLRVCHLGSLSCDLNEKQLEIINGIDILIIPIGGKHTIDAKKAVEIIKKIEPKMVIPIHYETKNLKMLLDDEKKFCAEIGNCPQNKVSKFNIKKKETDNKNMEVMLMSIN